LAVSRSSVRRCRKLRHSSAAGYLLSGQAASTALGVFRLIK
jgi:hypothetical protein